MIEDDEDEDDIAPVEKASMLGRRWTGRGVYCPPGCWSSWSCWLVDLVDHVDQVEQVDHVYHVDHVELVDPVD